MPKSSRPAPPGTRIAVEPESGPRKCHKTSPPDFSQPDALVTFLIGPDTAESKPKTFLIHKEVACYHSPIFNAAFDGTFVEGQTQTYRLEDVSPECFKLLCQWLYSPDLQFPPLGDKEDQSPEPYLARGKQLQNAIELWILADRLIMRCLQDNVLAEIYTLIDIYNSLPCKSFDYVYANTDETSMLRRFFVEVVGIELPVNDFVEVQYLVPRDMLFDLVVWE